jgi:hypothetical protein
MLDKLDIRRPGWNWPSNSLMSTSSQGHGAPFCHEDVCYTSDTAETCANTNGASIADHYCLWSASSSSSSSSSSSGAASQPEEQEEEDEVQVLGPTCWAGKCYISETQDFCNVVGGTCVGYCRWCIFRNNRFQLTSPSSTMVGPTCWGDTCHTSDTVAVCHALGGSLIGERWCILPSHNAFGIVGDPTFTYTVVGPTCWRDTCYTDAPASACSKLGGQSIGDVICIIQRDSFNTDQAKQYSVIGPTCYDMTATEETCYTDATSSVCEKLGGESIDDHFCIVPGSYTNHWSHVLGRCLLHGRDTSGMHRVG